MSINTLICAAKRLLFAVLIVSAGTQSASAQISKVDSVMTNIQNMLMGVAVVIFSIALIWAGFKMA